MIKVSFTGDIMCEHTRLASYMVSSAKYDFSSIFKGIKHILTGSDYTVVNLETPFAGEEHKYSWKDYQFNTPDEFAEAMVQAGVGMAVTANNHVLDRGISGLVRTLNVLDDFHIDHTGTFRSKEENHPFIKDINGIKIVFLSYTYGTEACYNGNYLKKNEDYYVNMTRKQELSNPIRRYLLRSRSIFAKGFRFIYRHIDSKGSCRPVEERREPEKKQLKHLFGDLSFSKKHADFTVVCLHSGGQFSERPTDYTKRISALCLKNGADAVICNHEHLIHGADFFEDGKVITYCLGNLTSNYGIDRQPFDKNAECSVIFHISLDKSNNGIKPLYSFSIVSSVRGADGRIETVTMKERLERAVTSEEQQRVISINTECVNKFLGTSLKGVVPQEEYSVDEILCRVL